MSDVFSPSAPITTKSSFYGRYDQLNKVESAVYERGQHIVMYGERGVGKTSLANVAEEIDASIYTVKITCSRSSSFGNLWREILKSLKYLIKFNEKKEIDENNHLNNQKVLRYLDTILEEDKLDIQAVLFALSKLKTKVLIVLDEFDVIQDENILSQFADNIKSFSDNLPNVTLMFVGIAENISELIGKHSSLERCICQVPIPRMADHELKDVIDSGLYKLKMFIDEQVKKDIISFSQGFPHFTHLLSKYCVLNAIEKKYNTIVRNNFDEAINLAIENVYESTQMDYQKSISSNKEGSLYSFVVRACALVKEGEQGTFKATDILEDVRKLSNRQIGVKSYSYHLSKLCSESRGQLLQKIPLGKIVRYRFRNSIVKAYIILKLYQSGFLKKRHSIYNQR